MNLGDLDDVDLTGLQAEDGLKWNGTFWVPKSGRLSLGQSETIHTDDFASAQEAVDFAFDRIDQRGFGLTIQLAPGQHEGLVASHPAVGGTPRLVGDVLNPDTIFLSPTTPPPSGAVLYIFGGANLYVEGIKFHYYYANSVYVSNNSRCYFGGPLTFGPIAPQYSHWFLTAGSGARGQSGYKIVGGGGSHIATQDVSWFRHYGPSSVVLENTPHFVSAFAKARPSSLIRVNKNEVAYYGQATGKKYLIVPPAAIDTHGAPPNFFPGSVAGTGDYYY